MSSLTLSNIQKSVAKVTDIMDVQLNDINENYLVDNFKPPSLLRNTVLRSELHYVKEKLNLCYRKVTLK